MLEILTLKTKTLVKKGASIQCQLCKVKITPLLYESFIAMNALPILSLQKVPPNVKPEIVNLYIRLKMKVMRKTTIVMPQAIGRCLG